MINYFKEIGDSKNQAEIEQLKNYYQTAEEGIDPVSLVKVKVGKRMVIRKSAFHCLSNITGVLQTELHKDQVKLETAKQTIGSLIISLIQAGIITEEELTQNLDQNKLEIIWQRISQSDQVKLHERNLRLSISREDIFLLFTEVMTQISN